MRGSSSASPTEYAPEVRLERFSKWCAETESTAYRMPSRSSWNASVCSALCQSNTEARGKESPTGSRKRVVVSERISNPCTSNGSVTV